MFATGYGEEAQIPSQHRARIVLQKPYTLNSMTRGLSDLLSRAAAED